MLFAAVTGWVTHLRWWCWRQWCIIFKHTVFCCCWYCCWYLVGTPLAWWLLAWREHFTDPHPNHDLHFVIFCCFTLKLSHSRISTTLLPLKLVSLHLEMQLVITSTTSGTEISRHLLTTSYTVMLLPVSFRCLLVHRSSTRCTLCPMFLAPTIQIE